MKHVSVLVPAGKAVLSSVVGAFKLFNAVNEYMMMSGQQRGPYFKIDLVGISPQTSLYEGCFQINTTKTIDEVEKTDLIIVTTVMGDFDVELPKNAPFIDWIRMQRINNDAEIASLCTGAFLLAETGLLDGKACATHWVAHEEFKQRYPDIHLQPEKIITEENGIYTSGGAYSFLNLLLHLIEKYCGRSTALWCSKMFEIEFNRNNQSEFIVFQAQKDHHDESIKRAQALIEQHVEEKINIEDLARQVALSRRSFIRRFKKATSNTPLEYIQRVKIEAAKKKLESSTKTISEVMYSIGYNDTKSFRNIFKKITGLSPNEYRNKYNREIMMV